MFIDRDCKSMLALGLQFATQDSTLNGRGHTCCWATQKMNYEPHFIPRIDGSRRFQVQTR